MIWRNKRKRYNFTLETAQGGSGIVPFRYTDLQHATKNFTEKLGEGSFGSVFRGVLSDSTTIAVKRLDAAYQREKQFRAEVSSIGLTQHINLIKVTGFCSRSDSKLLVYEYMPHRSLDIHLFSGDAEILNWNTRYQITLGIARGLAYFHESCRDCIIHCDVKPQNILVDKSFISKIADFGMAKFLGREFSRALTTIRGTIGYLAPELISGGAITPKVMFTAMGCFYWKLFREGRTHIENVPLLVMMILISLCKLQASFLWEIKQFYLCLLSLPCMVLVLTT
jgi:serine/threonine protein kinase